MTQDYSLLGKTGKRAVETGLSNPKWFRPKVDPADIRRLMEKSDTIALRDTVLWLGGMIICASIGIALVANALDAN